MFKENITREVLKGEYTSMTAMLEVITIILVSFIFGWIARWLWDEFFVTKYFDEEIIISQEEKNKNLESKILAKEVNQDFKEKEVKMDKKIKRIEKDGEEVIVIEDNISPQRVSLTPLGIKNNDLKIVEGIGPKIEGLLKRAGIENWKDLSEKKSEELKSILKEAGDRYAFHDPSTWPEQAALAYENKWSELEEFQNFLSGGKRI